MAIITRSTQDVTESRMLAMEEDVRLTIWQHNHYFHPAMLDHTRLTRRGIEEAIVQFSVRHHQELQARLQEDQNMHEVHLAKGERALVHLPGVHAQAFMTLGGPRLRERAGYDKLDPPIHTESFL